MPRLYAEEMEPGQEPSEAGRAMAGEVIGLGAWGHLEKGGGRTGNHPWGLSWKPGAREAGPGWDVGSWEEGDLLQPSRLGEGIQDTAIEGTAFQKGRLEGTVLHPGMPCLNREQRGMETLMPAMWELCTPHRPHRPSNRPLWPSSSIPVLSGHHWEAFASELFRNCHVLLCSVLCGPLLKVPEGQEPKVFRKCFLEEQVNMGLALPITRLRG